MRKTLFLWATSVLALALVGMVVAQTNLTDANRTNFDSLNTGLAGTVSDVALSLGGDQDSGLILAAANIPAIVAGGVAVVTASSGGVDLTGTTTIVTGPFRLTDGTAAAPSGTFATDEDLGIYREGANSLGFAAGGSNIADIDASGLELNAGTFDFRGVNAYAMQETSVSSAQVLALNATPITVVAAPGAGNAVVVDFVQLFVDFNAAAYAGIAAGEDIVLVYSGGAVEASSHCETTGLMDATADRVGYCPGLGANGAVAGTTNLTAQANTAVDITILTGEIITGDSPLKVRVFYRIVPVDLSAIS